MHDGSHAARVQIGVRGKTGTEYGRLGAVCRLLSSDGLSSFSLFLMYFVSTTHFLCRMSQENKAKDGLEEDIQGYKDQITQLMSDLRAALKQPPINEVNIKFLKEELAALRGLVLDLRKTQASIGVGSSTQSKYCGWLWLVVLFAFALFVSKVYMKGCYSSLS